MPKQLNVDLRFNADTSQAKKQIQDLQASLTKLNSVDTFLDFKGTDAQMQSAMRTVSQLKSQLQSAFNVDTGKLDLTRFTAEMQKGGMSLEKYRQQLTALGPEGTEAFNKLANAVSAADVPLRQTNKILAEMGTVLKNTIRWQISSSMIHGFMGAIQRAYGYAQDLNESLTNIRIVTGQSTDQMAAFAAQANKAAQALSTTTTAYTDAALIFYQQGLSDSEVEERTNAVIKMSQATGDAATEVSSYMTAVWNNFDNGSESLEHYADVITALGAATASSSSEIAQGLEKFASIADTVGLSYEYATTALATVVAQTRQSADVVGTAFKTMFARFQDLELGKTLEDGTDLGQYSKALAKVGVDIKDANGGLRDMNDILDDLGAKWATLADDQKVALAQNVAGQRQYAQLVALMDNWDKFQENLITANSAEGTLQEQADIYAESWEAAKKRVQASMESIYQSIIDDKFFINLNNTLASTLKFVNNLIKSFGGLPGIISAAGVLLTRFFGPQMANSIRDIALNLQMSTKSGREKVVNQKTEATQQQIEEAQKAGRKQDVTIYNQQLTAQKELILNSEKMTKEEQDRANLLLKEVDSYKEQALEAQKVVEKEQENLKTLEQRQRVEASRRKDGGNFSSSERFEELEAAQEVYKEAYKGFFEKTSEFNVSQQDQMGLREDISYFVELSKTTSDTSEELERLKNQYNLTEEQIKELVVQEKELYAAEGLLQEGYDYAYETEEQATAQKSQFTEAVQREYDAHLNASRAIEVHKNKIKEFIDNLKKSSLSIQDFATGITNLASSISSFAMIGNQIKGIVSTFDSMKKGEISLGEGLLAMITSASMLIPNVINGFKQFKAAAVALKVSVAGLSLSITVLVAAIGFFVYACKQVSDAFNADAVAAEKARKAAQDLAGAFDKAREAYNKMKDSMSKYNEAKKSLSELTKGTEEYTEALKEANEAAMELITTGNLTANQYHYEDGLLVIDDAVMSEAVHRSEQTMLNAQAASQMGQAQALAAQSRADLTTAVRLDDGLIANDLQYSIGPAITDLLTFGITKALGSTGQIYDTLMQEEWDQRDEIERIAEEYQTIGEAALQNSSMFKSANEAMQESIKAYCEQAQQAEVATQAYAEQVAQANLASQGFNDEAISFAAQEYRDNVSDIYDEVIQLSNDRIAQIDTETNQTAQQLWARYRQATGLNAQLVGVEGNDKNRTFTYYDEQHELQHVYIESMASAISAAEAIDKLGDSAEKASEFLNNLSGDEQQKEFYQQAIGAYRNGHVHFEDFIGEFLSGSESVDISDWNTIYNAGVEENVDAYIEGAIAAGQGVLRDLGIESTEDLRGLAESLGEDYIELFNDLMQGYSHDFENFTEYFNSQSQAAQDLYNNSELNNINHNEARTILDLFSNAINNGVASNVNSIVSQMTQEELSSFAKGLNQINWNTDNYNQFLQILSNSGVNIDRFSSSLETLYNSLRIVTRETLAASTTFYNNIESIIGKLTDANDEISPEDYAKLPDYIQQYFTITLDGTYKLIEGAREFQRAIRQERIDEAVRIRESATEQAIQAGQILQQYTPKVLEDLQNESLMTTTRFQTNDGHIVNRNGQYSIEGSSLFQPYIPNPPRGYYTSAEAAERDLLQAQWEYSGLTGNFDPSKLNENGEYTEFDKSAIQRRVEMIRALTDEYNAELDQIGDNFTEETVNRIDTITQEVMNKSADYIKNTEQEYADALATITETEMALALSYDNLDELQEAYQDGTINSPTVYNTAAYQIDQAQDTAMLDTEEWDEYADYIQEASTALDDFNDRMSDLEADIVAKSILKMNQAIELLANNFEEWNDILSESDTHSAEYAEAMHDTREAVAMLLDTSMDYVSNDFVVDHLEDIQEAATGSETAIEDLRQELFHDIVVRIETENHIYDKDLRTELENLSSELPNIEIGATLTTGNFLATLNELVASTGMTVDQINALCDSMGFEATFVTEPQPVTRTGHEVLTTTYVAGYQKFPGINGDSQEVPILATRTDSGDAYEYTDYVDAIAMSTDGSTPQIESITRKPSAAHSNYSSSNSGGKKPGGGGSKSSSKKDKKDPTGEIERYHVINNQIEDNEKALNQLSKAKDRAYGKARLNAMDAEIAKQRESVELAERKLQEVEKYLELDAGAIAAFGAEFDTNGTIVNYDQLMQEQIDKYNAAVEAYNNGPMDENAEALFQQAEDDYNAFLEALKKYEETQDLWYEQAQAVADAKAQVLQLELEKTAYKVEIGIEWEDDDINRLDFLLKRIEDDAFKAAEAIGLLGEKTVDAMDKFNIYKQGFADVLSNLGVTNPDDIINRAMQGEDLYGMLNGIVDPAQMAQAVEQMNDYIAQMMSSLEQAQEAVDAAFEKVRDLFNENIKQMDTYIEKIEFCQKITKSYMNIIDIVGKKSLGITNEMLRSFNDQSVTQAVANETAAKAKMDSIEAQLNESRERLAQATTEKEKEYWEKLIAEQEKELITATENFHQAWEDALQANLEAYENNLELMIEDFSDAVGDLDAMRSEWDLQKSLTDMWEPEFERWHQLSTLISDINKSVEGNENLKYKNELLDLEKEIEGLQEEEAKLSEYDLNYLRLRYEAKLAEIALEEAQNAKSQVRMSRDSEGNYSYVYTADEEAVNNAADDYRNKIYEMEKANEEYIDTLQQQLMDMHDQMLEDIKEAGEIYGYGTEAYFDAVNRIEETYYAKSEFIQQQMQNVFDNNQRLRDEDIVDYVQYTGDIAAANVDLQLDFGDTFMGIQTGSDDLNTYFSETWLPSLRETFDNVIAKTQEYNERNEEIMNAAGTSMSEFGDLARSEIESVTDATSDLAKQTEEYGDSAADAFAEAAQAWQNGPAQLLESIQAQMDAVANLAQQYINLKSQLDAAAESARALAAAMNQPVRSYTPSSIPSPGGSGQGPGGGGPSSTSPSPDTPQDLSGAYRAQQALVAELVKELKKPMTSEVQARREELRRQLHELEARYGLTPSGYETGGYTGEWGDDGRLAILHQKELVLNAKDTSNILSAVDVVRQLASSIDLNTMAANLAGTSISLASGSAGTIEQKVEISASFPNVTDRNEIEQAFNNLVNNASQYANRKD